MRIQVASWNYLNQRNRQNQWKQPMSLQMSYDVEPLPSQPVIVLTYSKRIFYESQLPTKSVGSRVISGTELSQYNTNSTGLQVLSEPMLSRQRRSQQATITSDVVRFGTAGKSSWTV